MQRLEILAGSILESPDYEKPESPGVLLNGPSIPRHCNSASLRGLRDCD